MDLIEPHLKFSPSGLLTPQHWGLILAEGPDAGTFLQGQLTNDVLLLPEGQARFAGYCSAKGRLLGSFVVLKISKEKYLMVCHQDAEAKGQNVQVCHGEGTCRAITGHQGARGNHMPPTAGR